MPSLSSWLWPLILVLNLQGTPDVSNTNLLKSFGYLLGSTWSAKGEMPGFGKYVIERTYRWALDSSFIEQRHVMTVGKLNIKVVGFIGWDREKGKAVAWGFGNDGGVATTTGTIKGSNIVFEGSRSGGYNGGPVRSEFKKVAENEFVESAEVQKEGKWIPAFEFHFTRETH
jgi:hypothetical protein